MFYTMQNTAYNGILFEWYVNPIQQRCDWLLLLSEKCLDRFPGFVMFYKDT